MASPVVYLSTSIARPAKKESTYLPFDKQGHQPSPAASSSKKGSTPSTPVDEGYFPNAAPFAFDIPEHLSSSPICPANPKNKSGGKGVCVVSQPSKLRSIPHNKLLMNAVIIIVLLCRLDSYLVPMYSIMDGVKVWSFSTLRGHHQTLYEE